MPKKIPQRTCMACQEKKDKRDLVRIVRSPEGEISVDLTGKKPGRGAYICPDEACLAKAEKNRGLERSFKASVDPSIYEQLRKELENYDGK